MHDNAWIYDLEVGGYTEDLDFWRSLVRERNARRVLDLACGTGRITFAIASFLAKSNTEFRVVGVDNSPPLLEAAREKLKGSATAIQDNVEFLDGDMVNFRFQESFDLIVIGFNSLMYITAQEDQISCLKSVRNHLAPGGALAFDILVPANDYLAEAQRLPAVRLELELAEPEQGIKQFLRFSTERYDPATQLSRSDYFYEIYYQDGRQERFTDRLDWQMIFPREMELLGRLTGLMTAEAYGDFNRAPFNSQSRQMVWVMESAGEPDSAP